MAEAVCPNCREPAAPNSSARVDEIRPWPPQPLAASAFRLTISSGSTASRVGLLPAGRRPRRRRRRAGGQAVEPGRDRLRRGERTASPNGAAGPTATGGYACLAYEVPGPVDLPIFLDRRAADAIERHALRDTSVELGGILLGKECLDEQTGQPFVWSPSRSRPSITRTPRPASPTRTTRGRRSPASATGFPELDIVGWYHTHPDFGIFLSHHDLFIHQHFFAQPLQVAYVVDPIQPDARVLPVAGPAAGAGGRVLPDGRSRRSDRPGEAGQRPGKSSQSRRKCRRGVFSSPRGGAHQDAHQTVVTSCRRLTRREDPDGHRSLACSGHF